LCLAVMNLTQRPGRRLSGAVFNSYIMFPLQVDFPS
jgi:hypothetical protein